MSTTTATAPRGAIARRRPPGSLRAAGRDQAVVAGGQLLAGLGNLAFVAIAARTLPAGEFADLASFIAVLTMLHLPAAGLAAAGALAPDRALALRRRCLWGGVALGVVLTVAASPLSGLVGLPVSHLLALAWAAPAAPLLGLHRGFGYGNRDHRAVVASLLAEPACRLALGLALAASLGGAGAAWGAAAGGWVALVALNGLAAAGPRTPSTSPATKHPGAAATGIAFVALAILQHQDLVLANRLLDAGDAGAFAALSTIGGLVAFATATLPLVLLPASRRQESGSLLIAAGAAVAVAVGAVLVALVASDLLVQLVVGDRYGSINPLVAPYLAGMGSLGVARVLAAHRCGVGAGRRVAWVVGAVVVAHGVGILALARTPGQVVAVSTISLMGAAAVLALPVRSRVAGPGEVAPEVVPPAPLRAGRDAWLLLGATAVAVALRLATERSFWIDEAVSVSQAQMSLGGMVDNLRATDVHPPLHHLVLWGTSRVLGISELSMRLPSIVFGAALVPVMYGAAKAAFDRRTARVAALLVVPAPFLVWYSQEARMYSLFMLIGVASVWAQIVALRTGRTRAWVAWGVLSALLIWTQWFALLPLVVQQVGTVLHVMASRREHRPLLPIVKGWALSLAVTIWLVVPLVPFLVAQLEAYAQRGAGLSMPSAAGTDSSSVLDAMSSYALIANVIWAVGGYHSDDVMTRLGALWPLAMLGCLLLLGRRAQPTTRLIACVAIVPALVLYLVGFSKRDLFELRYFVLAAPLLILLIARGATSATRTRLATGGLTVALLALSMVGLVDQQLNGTNPRLYDFRGAVSEIEPTAQPGDVLAYAPDYLNGVLGYYAPDLVGMPLDEVDPEEIDGEIYVLVSERLTPGSAGAVGDQLARLEGARGEPERFTRPNVVVWRFP